MRKSSIAVGKEFAGVDFGDKRLDKRLRTLAADLAAHPDQSLPKACGQAGKAKAAYRFFSNDRVALATILEPHFRRTVGRCASEDVVLAIQDTSFFNFTAHKATKGLGWIGAREHLRGLAVHTTLALSPDGDVLGLLAQEIWARMQRMPKDESSYQRSNRSRESERWIRAVEAVSGHGLVGRPIHIMDREGDIYEALDRLEETGQSYVIRACQDRVLRGEKARLFETVSERPELGTFQLRVRARAGRSARTAELTVRSATVTISPPRRLKRGRRELSVGIVQVIEPHPPKGAEGLEWLLLTREAHSNFEECMQVVRYYGKRWAIEDFHMALKTGCRVEERQLQNRDALESFIGVADVIAVMMLRLRHLARNDDQMASAVLTPLQLELLAKQFPKLGKNPKARDALRSIAQLGGFLGRRNDGHPGWRTIWRGMHDLLVMARGYALAFSRT